MDIYQSWLRTEKAWINQYCKKTLQRSLFFVAPLTMIFMTVFVGLLQLFDGDMNQVLEGALSGAKIGFYMSFFYLVIMHFSLVPQKFVRKIEKSVAALGMDDEEKAMLAQEMITGTLNNKQIEFEMVGPKSAHTPAKFLLTKHYGILIGSNPYSILVRLSDIGEIKRGEENKVVIQKSGRISTRKNVKLYTIMFYNKDYFDNRLTYSNLPNEVMGFFSKEIRDEAFELIKTKTNLVDTYDDQFR